LLVMNPPFEAGQDIDHVRHAYACLAPGGHLVSIMSEAPFFRSDTKAVAFRTWLDELGGTSEHLPEDAFQRAESFRETGCRTRLVLISKHT
jgi:16S rRNA G1207 methylase RsmC